MQETTATTYNCDGCMRVWKRRSDMMQHFTKSSAPACKAALERRLLRLRLGSLTGPRINPSVPSRPRSPSTQPLLHTPSANNLGGNSELGSDGPANTGVFTGDFFGDDYHDKDFPGFPLANGDNSSDDDDEEEMEEQWEPPRGSTASPPPPHSPMNGSGDSDGAVEDGDVAAAVTAALASASATTPDAAAAVAAATPLGPYITMFPGGAAGRPQPTAGSNVDLSSDTSEFARYQSKLASADDNLYAPFVGSVDWDMAKWAKLRGQGSTAFTDLLKISGIVDALGLSFGNSNELNQIIDESLPPGRPKFVREEVVIGGESFDLFKRDVMECVRALYGDPQHSRYLVVAPERHYSDSDKTIRLYHDFHTGRWWWDTQRAFESQEATKGATIIPIILSSDKTQITLFRNKSAYPVYLTIGNLPKDIRRKPSRQGQILLAYLPTTRLSHITNVAARRRTIANLFHACMGRIVEPIIKVGATGCPMRSGDGCVRRGHPIVAAYVGDYPEQVLVTTTYTGDSPVCDVPAEELGHYPCEYDFRDFDVAVDAASKLGTAEWAAACLAANIKPVQHPFWEDLPYVNIFRSITPDILHQMYQGVMKHLIAWLSEICGEDEIDARVRRLPPNHSIRIFHKGITTLSRVSGTEHRQMCSFILGVIDDAPIPSNLSPVTLLSATRGLLDALYIAQFHTQDERSLSALDAAILAFHENKQIFIDLGAREHFNFPKLHALAHYSRAIRLFGSTDNYNTESTERLHIDLAKDAYRASNRKDEYPQMTKWLERREKVIYHSNYIAWRLGRLDEATTTVPQQPLPASANEPSPSSLLADIGHPYTTKMTHFPTHPYITLSVISAPSPQGYGATLFIPALTRFIAQFRHPNATARQLDEHAHHTFITFRSVPVFHKVKFINEAFYGSQTLDSIHCHPRKCNDRGQVLQNARFDTGLIRVRDVNTPGALAGMRVGRIRVIFSIPETHVANLFPANVIPPQHLAYVEWFSNFSNTPEAGSGLHRVRRQKANDGTPLVSVIPVSIIQRSVHLIPKWGKAVPQHWTSENVLDLSPSFLVNTFKDPNTYFYLESGRFIK